MRPHGRASISPTQPRALAICDRCGFRYNHIDLVWTYQWVGPRLQNTRRLVCQSCLDVPQEQLRTVIYPPDPMPIINARPEANVEDMNPLSGIGASPNWLLQQYGSFIGNLTEGGGISAAFDSNQNKPGSMSAVISISTTDNYVGVNWSGNVDPFNTPTDPLVPLSVPPPIITHTVSSFVIVAPNDTGFLGTTTTTYSVEGSSDASTWTTLASGTTDGSVGETISGTCTGSNYQYHRVNLTGDGNNSVSIAQIQFSVANIGTLTERS